MSRALLLLLAAMIGVRAADADFHKWWPQFQAAVAKSDARAVAQGAHFPMDWENGPIRQIKTQADLLNHFNDYFTAEIKKAVANGKPGPLASGEFGVTWKARGNEYTIFFRPEGTTYALGGLSEGPP